MKKSQQCSPNWWWEAERCDLARKVTICELFERPGLEGRLMKSWRQTIVLWIIVLNDNFLEMFTLKSDEVLKNQWKTRSEVGLAETVQDMSTWGGRGMGGRLEGM